jgi:hypothetical protein
LPLTGGDRIVRAVSEHLFVRSDMVGTHGTQPLSYDLRLPDEAQADALRLLNDSRAVINQALTTLWPRLDDFAAARSGPAWKQVDALLSSPEPHGSRQWRCEAEIVGRILRAQAERKQLFLQVLPILSAGFMRPKTETRPAGKERTAIAGAITALQRDTNSDDASFVALQNVVEQCCNFFLQHDRFPATYEELQPLPLLTSGLLSYAGDDGGEQGQAYRLALDLQAGVVRFRFRCPDPEGA